MRVQGAPYGYRAALNPLRVNRCMTHTYALLTVSRACYDEIASLLHGAEYEQAFMDNGAIDMGGIALTVGPLVSHCVAGSEAPLHTAKASPSGNSPRCKDGRCWIMGDYDRDKL